jgi:hypothetical protein
VAGNTKHSETLADGPLDLLKPDQPIDRLFSALRSAERHYGCPVRRVNKGSAQLSGHPPAVEHRHGEAAN